MPILFVAHGAPMLLDDTSWMAELGAWGTRIGRPASILVLSAHWSAEPAKLGATTPVPLVYDFYGFPDRFYTTTYAAPGAPALAARVRDLLAAKGIAHRDDARRGLDHGAYVPLMGMAPDAHTPVLQLSLPRLAPDALVAFGRALAPLADEGTLVVGSGFLTHNMRSMGQPTAGWAREFDAWAAETYARLDVDAAADFASRAPGARLAHPTVEHYAPAVVAAAAAAEGGRRRVSFPITGFWQGSFTRRSIEMA